MATRDSEQPTNSNWDLENEQTIMEDISFPTYSSIQGPYQSSDEILTDDEDDADFYGVLLSTLTTTSQTISTIDTPLTIPATQLADSSLLQLQIHSPALLKNLQEAYHNSLSSLQNNPLLSLPKESDHLVLRYLDK